MNCVEFEGLLPEGQYVSPKKVRSMLTPRLPDASKKLEEHSTLVGLTWMAIQEIQ